MDNNKIKIDTSEIRIRKPIAKPVQKFVCKKYKKDKHRKDWQKEDA